MGGKPPDNSLPMPEFKQANGELVISMVDKLCVRLGRRPAYGWSRKMQKSANLEFNRRNDLRLEQAV